MIQMCRDTFIRFLADNVGSIPLHTLRSDPNDPGAGVLAENSINIQFLGVDLNLVSTQQVVIDIIHDTEATAVAWLKTVYGLLRSAYYTPLKSYTNPAVPVSQGSNVMWDRDKVNFRRVVDGNYCRYSCVLPLQFYIS
jgi:hypothetical protein